ncbi:MAG TPA: hypothetical protein VFX16_21395 [Pseudonocardiaceae bacterium]|nr:hypothetical protein [Pseudonocardiaceae bacterium]
MNVRQITEADRPVLAGLAVRLWGADAVVGHDTVFHPLTLPGFLALDDDIVGVLTYTQVGDAVEVVTIDALRRHGGIGSALLAAVHRHDLVANCLATRPIELDLLVGASLTTGSRSARIQPHDKMTARRVPGLETAVVDRCPMTIKALDPSDDRAIRVHVAGPAALLVTKTFKIKDRLSDASRPDRVVNKDAADVIRIMTTNPAAAVSASFSALVTDDRIGTVTAQGLCYLRELFGGAATEGVVMAVRALAGDVPRSLIETLAPAFVGRLPAQPSAAS